MRDIEPLSQHGPAPSVEDVLEVTRGLETGARYAASDLYARYCDLMAEKKRTPGHQVAFGQALRRAGYLRVKMNVGGSGRGHRGERGRQVSAWVL